MESLADSKVWADYNAAQAERPVRSLCLDAMAFAGPGNGRRAIDLGCGAGKETLAMLRAGWHVHAVDSLPDTSERLLAIAPPDADGRLSIEMRAFQDLRALPLAGLIFAGYSLPFIHPARFAGFWDVVLGALRRQGVLAVNLFGDRDSWADVPEWNFHTEAAARQLFDGLEILKFEVYDDDGQSFRGPKHWHIYDVIARKP
ncbi:trans-aconitate methyltransferase [Pseudarthrobacter oxydans]|uniref:class I SAM-dependent methyltransferase n=1 Tax=Pseudarthrobacter oxydans TaxID=1671 RepID=UPI00277FC73F|nr:class I SAM-dependent methyltransferase [Pseudarthrobacter oxydans]MDP9983544.1 trans-aconitate methyltransferase [Pseudarthrobacter oxydans]